jgi:hypothetical protein
MTVDELSLIVLLFNLQVSRGSVREVVLVEG